MINNHKLPISLKFVVTTAVVVALTSFMELVNQIFVLRQFSMIPSELEANWSNFAIPITLIILQGISAIVAATLVLRKRSSFPLYNIALLFLVITLLVAIGRWILHIAPDGSSLSSSGAFLFALWSALTHGLFHTSNFGSSAELLAVRATRTNVVWVAWVFGLSVAMLPNISFQRTADSGR